MRTVTPLSLYLQPRRWRSARTFCSWVGLGVLIELVAVGEDVTHDREPVLAGGLGRGDLRGRGRDRGRGDSRGRGGVTRRAATLQEQECQDDRQQDRDGDADRKAGAVHWSSLGTEAARTRIVSGGWFGRRTRISVRRTCPERTTTTWGGSGVTSTPGGAVSGRPP